MHICRDEIAGIFAVFAFCCMSMPWIRHYADRVRKYFDDVKGDD